MKRALALLFMLQLCTDAAYASSEEVSGSVHNPGLHQLPSDSRLSHLALAAAPTADAYILGTALLRESQRPEQTRLKAGLIYDLEQLTHHAGRKPAVAASIRRMSHWINSLPVTGRLALPLEPRALEATRSRDVPVQAGDVLFYPERPSTITITGAVSQQCSPSHISLQEPAAYLRHCPQAAGASSDYIHVIQPDGHSERLGIARWNLGRPSTLAPGAIIYIPLAEKVVRNTAPHFNEDAVRFLATQLLAEPGTNP